MIRTSIPEPPSQNGAGAHGIRARYSRPSHGPRGSRDNARGGRCDGSRGVARARRRRGVLARARLSAIAARVRFHLSRTGRTARLVARLGAGSSAAMPQRGHSGGDDHRRLSRDGAGDRARGGDRRRRGGDRCDARGDGRRRAGAAPGAYHGLCADHARAEAADRRSAEGSRRDRRNDRRWGSSSRSTYRSPASR